MATEALPPSAEKFILSRTYENGRASLSLSVSDVGPLNMHSSCASSDDTAWAHTVATMTEADLSGTGCKLTPSEEHLECLLIVLPALARIKRQLLASVTLTHLGTTASLIDRPHSDVRGNETGYEKALEGAKVG